MAYKNAIEKNYNKDLLNLYRLIRENTATAETFEKAIQEQGLTNEIIKLIKFYYTEEDLK